MAKANPIHFTEWHVIYRSPDDGELNFQRIEHFDGGAPLPVIAQHITDNLGILIEEIERIRKVGRRMFRGRWRAVEMQSYEWDGEKWEVPFALLTDQD